MTGTAPSAASTTAPSAAERIRSACARTGAAVLAADGVDPVGAPVHHLLADGSVALAVPAGNAVCTVTAAAGTAGLAAVLELTDRAPLPLREPVRALVWLRGRLHRVPEAELPGLLDLVAAEHPDPALLRVHSAPGRDGDEALTLLRLELESAVAADAGGAESVAVAALLAARPDPFCAMESCWLQHLEAAHPEVLDRLAARLPAALRRGRVRPLALDRYGVQLRIEHADGDRDVRLPFPRPVDDVPGLSRAIRILMGCPFRNGLWARRG